MVVGRRLSADRYFLVILVDEESLLKLKSISMPPFLGFENEVYPSGEQGKYQSIMAAVLQINLHQSTVATTTLKM